MPVSVEKIVRKYLTNVKRELIKEQKAKKFVASGESIKSLEIEKADGVMALVGSDVYDFIFNPRGPGRVKVEAIIEWVRIKRLDINPWAIIMKIKKEGVAAYRGDREKMDVDSILKRTEEEFLKDLEEAFVFNIEDLIE